MIDYYGKWRAEENYKVYPKEKWCDKDYMANWIKELKYKPKTTIENLIEIILAHYDGYLSDNDVEFYSDIKESENGLMISIKDVDCFVEEHGGFIEFDYYC